MKDVSKIRLCLTECYSHSLDALPSLLPPTAMDTYFCLTVNFGSQLCFKISGPFTVGALTSFFFISLFDLLEGPV